MSLKATFIIDEDKVGVLFADPHDAHKHAEWQDFTREEQIAIVNSFINMGNFFRRFVKEADNAE